MENKTEWTGMRTTGQVRREDGVKLVQNRDSFYKPIERTERVFKKLKISKSLQSSLPYASKPKLLKKLGKPSVVTKTAVIMEPEEKKRYALMQRINTIANEKAKKLKIKKQLVHDKYMAKKAKAAALEDSKKKERAKEYHKTEGKKRLAAESKDRYKKKAKRE
jgi:ribosome biogenesis protein BMS1